jgi:hypothetical protein
MIHAFIAAGRSDERVKNGFQARNEFDFGEHMTLV